MGNVLFLSLILGMEFWQKTLFSVAHVHIQSENNHACACLFCPQKIEVQMPSLVSSED